MQVYGFGLADVLQFCHDNLIIKTPESISDPRFHSAEASAWRYSRVIGGSLCVLGSVIGMELLIAVADFDINLLWKCGLSGWLRTLAIVDAGWIMDGG